MVFLLEKPTEQQSSGHCNTLLPDQIGITQQKNQLIKRIKLFAGGAQPVFEAFVFAQNFHRKSVERDMSARSKS
jgi:hypothetical protein